jgi:hypothetical protein
MMHIINSNELPKNEKNKDNKDKEDKKEDKKEDEPPFIVQACVFMGGIGVAVGACGGASLSYGSWKDGNSSLSESVIGSIPCIIFGSVFCGFVGCALPIIVPIYLISAGLYEGKEFITDKINKYNREKEEKEKKELFEQHEIDRQRIEDK